MGDLNKENLTMNKSLKIASGTKVEHPIYGKGVIGSDAVKVFDTHQFSGECVLVLFHNPKTGIAANWPYMIPLNDLTIKCLNLFLRESRPEISKGFISKVGDFDENGKAVGWIIKGSDHPKSIGYYQSKDWEIYCGYTMQELREIKKSYIFK